MRKDFVFVAFCS